MTAKELYEELKSAADYFGVGFRGLNEIKVFINDDALVLSYGGREILISEEVFLEVEGDI